MPDLNEFLKKEEQKQASSLFEPLVGIKPCSKCEIDVDGGLWDAENLIMKWTCSNGHETLHRIG